MPTSDRRARAALALIGWAVLQASALAQAPAARIREALLAAPARAEAPDWVDATAAQLHARGVELIPELLALLDSGLLPGEPAQALEPRQEEAVVRALARFRRRDLAKPLAALLESSRRPDARADGLRLLGLVGDGRDLSTLCAALQTPGSDQDPDAGTVGVFRAAVVAILARDAGAYAAARTLLHGRSSTARFHLVGALADCGTGSALEILCAQVGSNGDEDLLLLCEIARLCAKVELPADEAALETLRHCLRDGDSNHTRAAAEALGQLEDFEATGELLLLLDDPEPDVARAALAALRRIAGAELLPDPERWRVWLADEADWFANRAPRLAQDLEHGDAPSQIAAVSAFAAHPLYRRQIAEIFQRVLPACRADVLALGCSALRQLGALSAIPTLEQWAELPQPLVAARASEALEGLRALRGLPPLPPRGAQDPAEPVR